MTTPRSERTEYVRLTLPAEPAQLGRLRHAMHEYLRPLPLSRDRRDEVVLAVGEAAANAVEHAYQHQPEPGVIDVTYWIESDALCVEIRDQGRWREPPPGPRPRGQGLGLVLMRRFIDCVLIHHDHRGTNVLLRHPMRSPAPGPLADPTHPWCPARGGPPRLTRARTRETPEASEDSTCDAGRAPLLLASCSRDWNQAADEAPALPRPLRRRRRSTAAAPAEYPPPTDLYRTVHSVLAVRVDERRIRPAGGDGAASPRRDDEPATEVVVEVERCGDTVRITITGEVDLANAAVTEQQILAAITGEPAAVTLDLTGLRYIDSAGLWVLFRLGTHLKALQIAGELLIPGDGPVRRMVETAGVAAAIPVRTCWS